MKPEAVLPHGPIGDVTMQLFFNRENKMNIARAVCWLFTSCLLLAATPGVAGPAVDKLTTCLTDNTNGKDRKALVKWVFVTLSAHPDLQDISSASIETKATSDKEMADILTTLITERCVEEVKAAFEQEGSNAFETPFEVLGKLAFQELTSDPAVKASISSYVKYLDKNKIESTFSKK